MTAAASPIRSGKQHGFTYVSVVILVMVIGLVGAASLRLGATLQRAAAEQALLDIGMEYSNALASYAAATPAGQPSYPNSFQELLKDPRFPQMRRHLRRIYVDPMTGKAEWGIMKATENGGILAIYSLSKAAPIKIANFPPRFAAFEGKTRLDEWRFTGEGVTVPGSKGAEPMPGQQPAKPGMPPPGSKPGMPQEPPKPTEPPKPAEPPPEPEPPQEPQEPPAEPPPEPQPEQPPADPPRR
ncbi:type II secretion system protein [Pseudoduganella sp. OTU4001]|uniref:type II secretion system protein n=1 Tax=Pseudoduganella sp. OTU4001 TaxID=3043854 RepID=UPI00313DC184